MKIAQLLSGVSIPLSNSEHTFVETHNDRVSLTSLDEHQQWIAQSLVRKGIYSISKDSTTLIKNLHEKSN